MRLMLSPKLEICFKDCTHSTLLVSTLESGHQQKHRGPKNTKQQYVTDPLICSILLRFNKLQAKSWWVQNLLGAGIVFSQMAFRRSCSSPLLGQFCSKMCLLVIAALHTRLMILFHIRLCLSNSFNIYWAAPERRLWIKVRARFKNTSVNSSSGNGISKLTITHN